MKPRTGKLLFVEIAPGAGALADAVRDVRPEADIWVLSALGDGVDFSDAEAVEALKRRLEAKAAEGSRIVVSMAPPWNTFSRARDRSARTRLRSLAEPWGVRPRSSLVEEANGIARASAAFAHWLAATLGASVFIENPSRSYLWELEDFMELLDAGFTDTVFDVCQYGGAHLKPTRLRCFPAPPQNMGRACR